MFSIWKHAQSLWEDNANPVYSVLRAVRDGMLSVEMDFRDLVIIEEVSLDHRQTAFFQQLVV